MSKKPAPSGFPVNQLAYVAVFAAFAVYYGAKAINGTATDLNWITLGASVLLLAVAAYRLLRSLGKPDA